MDYGRRVLTNGECHTNLFPEQVSWIEPLKRMKFVRAVAGMSFRQD